MVEKLPVKIKRQEPALWIERVVLFSKDNPWTVLQDFKFRRGVNVVWGASTDSADDAARGHSVGKTTLLRLMRYALGEDNFGTKADQEHIRYDFRRGHIGMTLHLGGTVWSVLRFFGVTGAELAGIDRSIEELVATSGVDESYAAFRHALEESFVLAWPFPRPPDSDRDYEWAHMLGWMARDQEARHRSFHLWRDKSSEAVMKAFLHERKDPLHFARMILGCVSPEEFRIENQIGDLDENIRELESEQQRVVLETDARRLNLESLIGAQIPPEQRSGALDFSALKEIGHAILERRRNIVLEASEMAENALRTCRDKKRSLEAQITRVLVALDVDDNKRKFPDELNKTFCDLARVPLIQCQPFQDRVNRIKEDILAFELSGQIMDKAQRSTFIAKKLEVDEELHLLNLEEKCLVAQVTDLSRKYVKAEAGLANYAELWEEWEKIALASVEDKPKDVKTLERLRSEKKRLKVRLDSRQLEDETKYQRLNSLYNALCRTILGEAYGGEIEYPPKADCFSFDIHAFHRKGNGAAVTTLGHHLADVAALVWAASGEGCHPGFLIHDSPREADMTERIYTDYLKGVHRLSEELGGEHAPFQYIFSTTTKPPQELTSVIRVELAGYPEEKLLFKRRLGKVDELALG